MTALRHIIKDINLQRIIVMETCMVILNNIAVYIQYLPLETNQSQWTLVLQEFETLFRHLEPIMIKSVDYTCLFVIMSSILKVPAIASTKVVFCGKYIKNGNHLVLHSQIFIPPRHFSSAQNTLYHINLRFFEKYLLYSCSAKSIE